MAVEPPVPPAPPPGDQATQVINYNTGAGEDRGHKFMWIAMGAMGLVLYFVCAIVSIGFWGTYPIDRAFEAATVLLMAAGLLKAKSG